METLDYNKKSDVRSIAETKREHDDRHDSFMIKAVLWFIALCVVGCVVCVILSMLKVAIQAMVIAAAILMFVALLGWVGYERARNRILARRDADRAEDTHSSAA